MRRDNFAMRRDNVRRKQKFLRWCFDGGSDRRFSTAAMIGRQIDLIWPVQPSREFFSFDAQGKSSAYSLPSRAHKGGVGHRHERWAQDAVDASGSLTNDPFAYGEVVWS